MDLEIWLIRIRKLITSISPFYLAIGSVVMFLLYFTVFGNQGMIKLGEINRTNQQMKTEVASLKDQIKERERQILLIDDPVYLESIVRQELGYVKPMEVIFQLTP